MRISSFQARVYAALLKIPRGYVVTYKALAKFVGCRSYRAVGQALRRNPFAPLVPCHRVISSDLGPGGFQGKKAGGALRKKLELLREEGVVFQDGKLADQSCLYQFPHTEGGLVEKTLPCGGAESLVARRGGSGQ